MKKILIATVALSSLAAFASGELAQRNVICKAISAKYPKSDSRSCVRGKLNVEPDSDEMLDFSIIFPVKGIMVECKGSVQEHNMFADVEGCYRVARD